MRANVSRHLEQNPEPGSLVLFPHISQRSGAKPDDIPGLPHFRQIYSCVSRSKRNLSTVPSSPQFTQVKYGVCLPIGFSYGSLANLSASQSTHKVNCSSSWLDFVQQFGHQFTELARTTLLLSGGSHCGHKALFSSSKVKSLGPLKNPQSWQYNSSIRSLRLIFPPSYPKD